MNMDVTLRVERTHSRETLVADRKGDFRQKPFEDGRPLRDPRRTATICVLTDDQTNVY